MTTIPRQKKLRFNFVDVFLILIILGAILSLFFLMKNHTLKTGVSEDITPVTLQFQIAKMNAAFKNLTTIGDTVYDAESGAVIGTVRNVTYDDYHYEGYSRSDGSIVHTPIDDYITMTLTVEAEAINQIDGYQIAGKSISIGDLINFRVPELTLSAECRAITVSQHG